MEKMHSTRQPTRKRRSKSATWREFFRGATKALDPVDGCSAPVGDSNDDDSAAHDRIDNAEREAADEATPSVPGTRRAVLRMSGRLSDCFRDSLLKLDPELGPNGGVVGDLAKELGFRCRKKAKTSHRPSCEPLLAPLRHPKQRFLRDRGLQAGAQLRHPTPLPRRPTILRAETPRGFRPSAIDPREEVPCLAGPAQRLDLPWRSPGVINLSLSLRGFTARL